MVHGVIGSRVRLGVIAVHCAGGIKGCTASGQVQKNNQEKKMELNTANTHR